MDALAQSSLPDTPLRYGRRERRRASILAAVVGIVVFAIGGGLTHLATEAEVAQATARAEQRAAALLASRTAMIRDWLATRLDSVAAIAGDDVLRLLATEVAAGDAARADGALTRELSLLKVGLARQAEALDASALRLFAPSGVPWLAVGADMAATDVAARDQVPAVLREGPLVAAAGSDALEMWYPVAALQQPDEAVGAVMVRLPVGALVARVERADPLWADGERIAVDTAAAPPDGARPPLTEREAGGTTVWVLERGVDGLPWTLTYESPRAAGLASADTVMTAGLGLSALAAVTVMVVVLAVSWRQGNEGNRKLAEQYRTLAGRIGEQRHLLDAIIDAVPEYLFVTDRHGVVRHANDAVSRLAGLPLAAILNRTLADILDNPTAAATLLTASAGKKTPQKVACEIYGERRWFLVSQNRIDVTSGGEAEAGATDDGVRWVTVAQDITGLELQRQEQERVQRGVMRALGRTVAAADPHLADHAAKLEQVAVAIADRLALPDRERTTLQLAAQVSQVGKLFVPRDLLTKTERLTAEERAVLAEHIDHAAALLRDVETDFPVAATVAEIAERLDGTGYPRGLRGDEISLAGRILAVADVFVARTSERAYRAAAAPEDIVDILARNAGRYDGRVVAALREVLEDDGDSRDAPVAAPKAGDGAGAGAGDEGDDGYEDAGAPAAGAVTDVPEDGATNGPR